MDRLKEKLRLCWEAWVSVLTAWTAVLRVWRSELWVRVCLARWCLAIYRRELLEHKYETARMEAGYWGDEAETVGNDWYGAEDLSDRMLQEDSETGSVLGRSWRHWGRLSLTSWLLLFPASWFSVLLAWAGVGLLSYGVFFAWLGLAAGWNGIPGAAALLNPRVRARLPFMPEAAALASLSQSAAMGLAGGFMFTCLHLEVPVHMALSGIVFGIMIFPLSFGLVFPLAIPLLCGFTVWRVTKSRGHISQAGYALLTGASAAGWLGVAVIGPVLGLGGVHTIRP